MQGLGKPGIHQMKMLEWSLFSSRPYANSDSNLTPDISPANSGNVVYGVQPIIYWKSSDYAVMGCSYQVWRNLAAAVIPKDLIHDAILNPPI
jgi:hypothetical protein